MVLCELSEAYKYVMGRFYEMTADLLGLITHDVTPRWRCCSRWEHRPQAKMTTNYWKSSTKSISQIPARRLQSANDSDMISLLSKIFFKDCARGKIYRYNRKQYIYRKAVVGNSGKLILLVITDSLSKVSPVLSRMRKTCARWLAGRDLGIYVPGISMPLTCWWKQVATYSLWQSRLTFLLADLSGP